MTNHLKKSVHLIIALVCSITLFLAGAFITPKPMTALADGPDASFTDVSFNNLGIADGTYGYKNNDYAVNTEFSESFNKKHFVGNVNFLNTGVSLYVAGTSAGNGLKFTLASNGYITVTFEGENVVNLNPARLVNTSLTTFMNKDIKLGVTFEKVNSNELTVAFYINDELYRDRTYTINKNVDSVLGKTVSIKADFDGAKIKISSLGDIVNKPSTALDWITTTNFYVADGTYGYADGAVAVKGSRLVSVNNSYFAANVTFSETEGASLIYGGKAVDGGRTGFKFTLSGGKLVMTDAMTGSDSKKEFIAADAGLDTFVNKTFKLGISIKTTDCDEDGAFDDVELGVWFNDKLYEESFIAIADFASYFITDTKGNVGNTLAVLSDVNGSTVTLGAVADLIKIMPDNTLTKLTFEHFGIADGKITKHTSGTYNASIDNTYFAGNVKYNGKTEFMYATDEGGWPTAGLDFVLEGDNLTFRKGMDVYKTLTPELAGLENFTSDFRMGISVQFVDENSDGNKNDVKLGVFFNEALYNNQYFILEDYADKMLSTIAFYPHNASGITVSGVSEFKTPITSRPLDSSFKKFTFDTVSILDKTYEVSDGLVRGDYSESLDGACFGAKVKFSATAGAQMLYAATEGNAGMTLSLESDGRLRLGHNAITFPTKYFIPGKAGLGSFADTEFRLYITTRYVDYDNDGEKDDVELGLWFNDILYSDEFIHIVDYVQHMNKYIYIYCPPSSAGTTLTVNSLDDFKAPIESRPLDGSFKKFTFDTVSILDKTYEISDGLIRGAYSGNFDGACFGATLTFSKNAGAQIIYAGTAGNAGMTLSLEADGRLRLGHNGVTFPTKYFLPSKTGLESFADTAFNLYISTRYVDHDNDGEKDDVELGIWFNDILYADEFIYLIDYVQHMDKYIYIYCPPANEGTTLTIGSIESFKPVVIPEELDSDLKLITLNNFSIKDAVYEDSNGDDANGLVANGAYLKTLNNTYFAFNANFSIPDKDAPISFQYAGKGDGWVGMAMEVFPDKITMGDNVGHSERYTFYAKKCGLDSFDGKDIKIGISTEYMDLDADGKEDDVRFGLWINDKLANNEYMKVIDYRQYIGDEEKGIGAGLGIYIKPSTVTEGDKAVSKHNALKAKLWSVRIPVRFEQFGFTDNWERELELFAASASRGTATSAKNTARTVEAVSPKTGRLESALNGMIFSCVALGGIMDIGKKRR